MKQRVLIIAFALTVVLAVVAICLNKRGRGQIAVQPTSSLNQNRDVDELAWVEHANADVDCDAAIKTNDLRFLGVHGYSVTVPGLKNHTNLANDSRNVRVLKGTSDVIGTGNHFRLQLMVNAYAFAYNERMLRYYQSRGMLNK